MKLPVNTEKWIWSKEIQSLVLRGLNNSRQHHRALWGIRAPRGKGKGRKRFYGSIRALQAWFEAEVECIKGKLDKLPKTKDGNYYIITLDHVIPKSKFPRNNKGLEHSWDMRNIAMVTPEENTKKGNKIIEDKIEERCLVDILMSHTLQEK